MTPPTPQDLAAAITDLRTTQDQLAATVEHLLEALEQEAPPSRRSRPGAWSWSHTNAERAAVVWAWLADFIDHLNTREELGTHHRIPPCWYLHGRAVEDLTALLAAAQDAYHGATGPTSNPIHYRDRWLWPSLERLLQRNSPCDAAPTKDSTHPGPNRRTTSTSTAMAASSTDTPAWPSTSPPTPLPGSLLQADPDPRRVGEALSGPDPLARAGRPRRPGPRHCPW
ncbi:hypothetical protein GCM10009660_02320 [Catellatospora bangladeshensis]